MTNIMHLIAVPRICKGLSGGDKVILLLSQHLDKSRFSVVIVGLKDSLLLESYLIKEATKSSISSDVVEMSNRFDLRVIIRLRRLLKKYQIDILHCHGYKADLIGFLVTRFSNIKLISTIHGWIGVDLKVKAYDFLDKVMLRFFARVVAVAGTFRERLLRWGISKDKVIVIYNSIDVDRINRGLTTVNIVSEFNVPRGAQIVGTVGRLSKEKGHKYFLEATVKVSKLYPDTIFFIIGEGPLKANLIKYAKKLGIADKVIFTGFRQDAVNFLNLFDIFVLPSITEGFPISILEAMALKKPTVATKVGDIPLMIKDMYTGILVNPKDSLGIANAITSLLGNKELATKLGDNAKYFVTENFCIKRQINEYQGVYEEVVKE